MPLQVAETCRRLGQRLGCVLWDEELNMPFMRSINPVRFPPVQLASTTISAAAPVRVSFWACSLPAEPARRRARPLWLAWAIIVGEVVYDIELEVNAVATMLLNSQADVLVVAGGYDFLADSEAINVLQVLARTMAQAVGAPAVALCPGADSTQGA